MAIDGVMARLKASVQLGMPARRALTRAIASTRNEELLSLVHRLSKLPDFRDLALGTPFPKSFKAIGRFTQVSHALSAEKLIPWTAAVLRAHAPQIRKFKEYEQKFDEFTSLEAWDNALILLSSCEAELGVSLWLLSNKLVVLERARGIDAQKALLQTIERDAEATPILRLVAHCKSMCAEATLSADSYYEYVLQNLISRLNGPPSQYLAFHVAFFGPMRLREIAEIIEYESASSVIDRFLTFIRAGQMLYADGSAKVLRKPYVEALRILGGAVEDLRISWLMAAMDITAQPLRKAYDATTSKAFDLYTVGDCRGALKLLHSAGNAPALPADVQDLAAACRARLSLTNRADSASEDRLDARNRALTSILTTDDNVSASIAAVKKRISTFPYSSAAPVLHSFVLSHASDGARAPHVRNDRMADVAGSPSNPRSIYFSGRNSREIRKTLYPLLTTSSTFALFAARTQKDLSRALIDVAKTIPPPRLAKYKALAALEAGEYPLALEQLDIVEEFGDGIDKLDGQEVRCFALIAAGDIVRACHVAARCIVAQPAAQRRFPLDALWESFETGRVDLSMRRLPIEVPNVLGLYATFRRRGREYRISTICEDFLSSWSVLKPTQLRDHADEFVSEQLTFFLSDVCLIAVLDSHGLAYDRQSEVEDERVEILRWLIELNPGKRTQYALEIADITRHQKIRAAIHSVEKSKIAVNVGGVKADLAPETQESFNRYLSLPYFTRAQLDELIQHVAQSGIDQKDPLLPLVIVLPRSERLEELLRFYDKIKDKFVYSNDFGLDAHLSAGIRHVILPNQLRACFERQALITERTSSGTYAPNRHWDSEAKREGASEEDVRDLYEAFEQFSQTIDRIIAELRDELLRVKSEKYPRGMFEFALKEADIVKLDKELGAVRAYEQAVDAVVDVLWRQTDEGLRAVQAMMRTELKHKMRSALDELAASVREVAESRIQPVEAAITRAGTDISDEIEVVINWFSRGGGGAEEDYDLGLAIDIALAMVNRCYVAPRLSLKSTGDTAVRMKAYTLNGLVSVLFWLFDNALHHGRAVDGVVSLDLSIKPEQPQLTIVVENDVASEEDSAMLEVIRQEIAAQATSERVRGEGKSGLIKIARVARVDLKAAMALNFGRDGSRFRTIVCLTYHGLWA